MDDLKKFRFLGKDYIVISATCTRAASWTEHPHYKLLVNEEGTNNFGTLEVESMPKNILLNTLKELLNETNSSNC